MLRAWRKYKIFVVTRRCFWVTGLLLLAYFMLLLTISGVFNLQMDLALANTLGSNDLNHVSFSFKLHPERLIGVLDNAEQESAFWWTQIITLTLALLFPFLRLVNGSILALLGSIGMGVVGLHGDPAQGPLMMQFGLLSIFILYSIYVLSIFFGEVRDKKKLTHVFSQYIPPELARTYAANPEAMNLDGESREITVMFCDIRGFTSISEMLEPPELARWLNRYFSLVSRIIVDHNGTIDKYMGDSVMAFWGAPVKSKRHASDALKAALEVQEELDAVRTEFVRDGFPEITVGIGICTGNSNVGNLGSEFRMAYTVVGDTVNIAERLERQTRVYDVPIIVAEATAQQLPEYAFRELDVVQVKGRQRNIKIYQPLGERETLPRAVWERLELHQQMLNHLQEDQPELAREAVLNVLQKHGNDPVYHLYLERIDTMLAQKNAAMKLP